jgi:hypothetical protein
MFAFARGALSLVSIVSLCGACDGGREASGERLPPPGQEREPAERERPEFTPLAGGLTWRAEEPFVLRPPENEMRAAEYDVRGHPEATLGIFYFGREQGGGGTVQSNVDRWVAQFTQPNGGESRDAATIAEREVNDIRVTTVDVRGTFVGRLGMGGQDPPRPDWRLVGAIAQGPQGLVFFKLTGPEAGIAAASEAFEHLVASIHPE